MRPWVHWCKTHHLKFIPFVVWFFIFPVVFASYFSEAYDDWKWLYGQLKSELK